MEREFIEAYINTHYPQWLRQCRRTCFLYGAADYAEDILQDAMCVLLTKHNISELYRMAHEVVYHYTKLDLYVIRSYKNILMNYKTTTRNRDKKIVRQVDIERLNVPQHDSDVPAFDVYDARQQLRTIVEQVAMPEPAKEIVAFVLVRGGNVTSWSSRNTKYALYNAGLAAVKQHIREQRISIQ